jgi:hypothetical protein
MEHLRARRGLYALIAVAGGGIALGGAWWGFAAVLPLLWFLPCAAMLAMCIKGHGTTGTIASPDSASNVTASPTAGDSSRS